MLFIIMCYIAQRKKLLYMRCIMTFSARAEHWEYTVSNYQVNHQGGYWGERLKSVGKCSKTQRSVKLRMLGCVQCKC